MKSRSLLLVLFTGFSLIMTSNSFGTDLTSAVTGVSTLASTIIAGAQVVAGAIGLSFGIMGLMDMMKTQQDPDAHSKGIKRIAIGSMLIALVFFMNMFANTLGGGSSAVTTLQATTASNLPAPTAQ